MLANRILQFPRQAPHITSQQTAQRRMRNHKLLSRNLHAITVSPSKFLPREHPPTKPQSPSVSRQRNKMHIDSSTFARRLPTKRFGHKVIISLKNRQVIEKAPAHTGKILNSHSLPSRIAGRSIKRRKSR